MFPPRIFSVRVASQPFSLGPVLRLCNGTLENFQSFNLVTTIASIESSVNKKFKKCVEIIIF